MILDLLDLSVSNISCPGHKIIRICKSHEKRPSATQRISFQASKQVGGQDYIVDGPDLSKGADRRLAGNHG
jgi:hypothetical protein